MSTWTDLRDAVRAVADSRNDVAKLGLGTPGAHVEINDEDLDTGAAWGENRSLQILLEGVAAYLDGNLFKRTAVENEASYTVQEGDKLIALTAMLAGGTTITVPTALITAGNLQIIVKDETGQAAAKNITIVGQAGELIDGAAALVISTNHGKASLYAAANKLWTY
jgi:hypothetical protein